MPILQEVIRVVPANAALLPHVTDLAYHDSATGPVLYATTAYGGGAVAAWDIDRAQPLQMNTAAHVMQGTAGTAAAITLIQTANGTALLSGGGASGPLQLWRLAANGSLGTGTTLGSHGPGLGGDLVQTITIPLGDGRQAVYGGLAGSGGIGRVVFDAAGNIAGVQRTLDNAQVHADQIAGLASAVIDGQRFLFSLGGADPGLTAWRIAPSGSLSVAGNLGVEEGLWISGPTALVAATAGGETYLVAGAAGSDSLTVVRARSDGGLVPVDHVLDTRDTRFGGVTALATAVAGGQTWIVAGGADDGISLFQLLPGGRLLHRAQVADSTAAGLANVSALALRATATGLEIAAGSALEPGITRLTFALDAGVTITAPAGGGRLSGGARADLLIGGRGNDTLLGGSGADVILDGAGSDTMTGGAGADIFVLSADGALDRITDFQPGQDRIDLSGWPLLRSMDQITMTSTATGIVLVWKDEVLILDHSGGRPILPSQLSWSDLFNIDRLPPLLFTDPATVAPSGAVIRGTSRSERLIAGDQGHHVIGNGGNDTLVGGPGNDILTGGNGRDRLDGGGGANILEGGLGDDHYVIRSPTDTIRGEIGWSLGGGIDTVSSWISYTLPPNVEILRLQGTADLNGSGNAAPEVLVGNPGANRLAGGGGNDRIVAKAGDDWIMGGMGRDELVGDAGADTFVYVAATESPPGIDRRDFINGFDRGIDLIDLSLIDAQPRVAGDQAFTFIGNQPFSGAGGELAYRWYGGNWSIIEADIDGDRVADMQIFVNLVSALGRDDFIL